MICNNKNDDICPNAQKIIKTFNNILSTFEIPSNWFNTFIIPLYKKNVKHDLNNYRGITIINTLSKIFCKIINEKLLLDLESINTLNKFQSGFISREECASQATALVEIINR